MATINYYLLKQDGNRLLLQDGNRLIISQATAAECDLINVLELARTASILELMTTADILEMDTTANVRCG